MKRLLIILCIGLSSMSFAVGSCKGRFVNPVTDICWLCMLPLTLGPVPVVPSITKLPDTYTNPISPVCACGSPIPRVGLSLGFWEPFALVDTTPHPFCMVNMGFGFSEVMDVAQGGKNHRKQGQDAGGFYWAHWYKYPLLYWLNVISSVACLQTDNFDVGYLTELDPTWNDDLLSFVLNPEAVLFGNPIAQLACSEDAIQTTANVLPPNDALFWCFGSQGSAYPLNGSITNQKSPVQATILTAERMTYKMHREGLVPDSIGIDGPALCHVYYMPIMPKDRYRYQMTNLIPDPVLGHPFGTTSIWWEIGHSNIGQGDNFGYLIWRKRNCCFI